MKTKIASLTILAVALAGCATKPAPQAAAPHHNHTITPIVINGVEGFHDTPMQPDGLWHVHDPARPQPPVVTTGTFSQEATPPSDAVVLFDGTDLSQWRD